MLNEEIRSNAPAAIVIGAGPIGLYAAFQLGLRGFRPVIVDALPHVGGQCAALYPDRVIYDAPGFTGVAAGALVDQIKDQLAPFSPLYVLGRQVMSIWGVIETGFNVETDTGETITGQAVIFAGGAGALRPRRLNVEGVSEIAGGLSYAVSDATDAAGRNVAVIGDGPAAVDAALDAAETAASVSLIHAAPISADAHALDTLREAASAGRMTIVKGEVSRLTAKNGEVTGVDVRSGDERLSYEIDLLLVQAGLELATAGVTGLGDVVDTSTGETSVEGVFVVGDATSGLGRPPVIAAGFSEAIRAAEAAARRVAPDAAGHLPHTSVSPTLQARLHVA